MMCNNISYMLDYQSTDLEDLRVSTRVADRFKYLQCATDKNESIKATIDALKPLAYSHKANHKLVNMKLTDLEMNLEMILRIMKLIMQNQMIKILKIIRRRNNARSFKAK